VLPTGPDRTLRFSYTAYSDDPGPSATATAAIMVSPRILLLIKPHHTSNRHTIHWTGTVTGGPYPQAGVTLDVEVREGRHWKIFDQVVTNRKGRFRYSYRFHATEEPTTYALRVALPDTGAQDYPYTHGASNTVEVHVDP
jgi:5-hydroxyisourate hydrolase-like protein (transthyretin family)